MLEIRKPLHFEGLTLVAHGTRGVVDADDGQVPKISPDKAAFVVINGDAHAILDVVRLETSEDGHATVSLALGREEVGTIAKSLELKGGNLIRLRLGFLQAEHVGLFLSQPRGKALGEGCPHAVDVVSDDFHHEMLFR